MNMRGIRHAGSPRHHNNKKPNPTNFSNLRSQRYLNEPEQIDIESQIKSLFKKYTVSQIPDQIFELSSECLESSAQSVKNCIFT